LSLSADYANDADGTTGSAVTPSWRHALTLRTRTRPAVRDRVALSLLPIAPPQGWEENWGPYLAEHPQTIEAYAADLPSNPKHMYNSNPNYPKTLAARYTRAPGRDRCVQSDVLRQTLLNRISIVTAVAWPMIAFSGGQAAASQSTVMRCEEATRARPQKGVVYAGHVDNDDYKLSLRVPDGLKGWGGVAPNAPFHGFNIFLDSELDACILFEVHLRVDPTDAPEHPTGAKSLQLGSASAWQVIHEAGARRLGMTAVITSFSSTQRDQIVDGEVLLITPTQRLERAKKVYEALLKSLKFAP
jgi:hypothetical protein